jgi:hypothetical protein
MLNEEQKHVFYPSLTIGEFLRTFCDELEVDGVSSSDIWSAARYGFGLKGDDIDEFARRAIRALIAAGARPARPTNVGPDFFIAEKGYDGQAEDIAERIVTESKELGHDPDHGWLWFYRFEANRLAPR